jgi:hypothetical protein
MSGGSFNYAYLDAESASSIFSKLDEIRGIEDYLRGVGKHEAANEVLLYIREMETHQRRIETIGKRIAGILEATEWVASGDSDLGRIDNAYWELMGLQSP